MKRIILESQTSICKSVCGPLHAMTPVKARPQNKKDEKNTKQESLGKVKR